MSNKKKIIVLATAICMVAILATGATLAYFTDKDSADNVFTAGNVSIDLVEEFEDLKAKELMPATGSAQEGTLQNGIKKVINVKNDGKSDAYVRVHIAIPAVLDNGDPSFDAGKNVLHFNYTAESIGEGLWDWSNATGAPYEGQWNYYETKIDGIDYNVYVVTYGAALKADETTAEPAMHQVYLDSKVTNEDVKRISEELGEDWHIMVAAEGAQAAGFTDAYQALNTAFGVPGTYDVDWDAVSNNYVAP